MKKKIILTLVLFMIEAAAFCETGYKNFKWGTSAARVVEQIGINNIKNPIDNKELFQSALIQNKIILGERNEINMFFLNKKLDGVGYLIPNNKKDLLIENFKKNIYQFKFPQVTQSEFNEAKEIHKEYIYNVLVYRLYQKTSQYEVLGISELKESSGLCQLTIYDYNDDTRVYIYENIIEGETVVVYVPHEQDY